MQGVVVLTFFVDLKASCNFSRRHITQQNLLFLIVGFLKNRKSVVDIMNPKLEEIALPFSEIQERMFKLHKLNPWMFVCAP